jgi:hypothetical protein
MPLRAMAGLVAVYHCTALTEGMPIKLGNQVLFWSSGDTKTGPPDGLLMGALRRPLDRCFSGGCPVVIFGRGISAA